jgi:hypothetical protein
MQRVIDRLAQVNKAAGRDGKSLTGLPDALKIVEKSIPDYRVPSRIWEPIGGGFAWQALRYSPLNAFGRYHYSLLKGFGEIGKDMVKGGQIGGISNRADAAGKVVAVFAMEMARRGITKLYQQTTGDDTREIGSHGPLAVVQLAQDIFNGTASPMEAERLGGLNMSPALQLGVGVASGVDVFG